MILENKSNQALRLVTFCLEKEGEEEGVERDAWLKQGSAPRSIKLPELSKAAPHWIQLRNALIEMG